MSRKLAKSSTTSLHLLKENNLWKNTERILKEENDLLKRALMTNLFKQIRSAYKETSAHVTIIKKRKEELKAELLKIDVLIKNNTPGDLNLTDIKFDEIPAAPQADLGPILDMRGLPNPFQTWNSSLSNPLPDFLKQLEANR